MHTCNLSYLAPDQDVKNINWRRKLSLINVPGKTEWTHERDQPCLKMLMLKYFIKDNVTYIKHFVCV